MRARGCGVVALAALALLALPAVSGAVTVGVNYNEFADPATPLPPEPEIAALESLLGVQIHRYGVRWSAVQPTGPDDWNWNRFDAMYAADQARGIRPLFVVSHAPGWAFPPNQACGFAPPASGDGGCNVPPDTSSSGPVATEYATFIRTLVLRYPDLAGIELWNEPNTDAQWQTSAAKMSNIGGSPSEYTAVLQATYQTVQNAEADVGHDVPVVTGGMHMSQATDSAHTEPYEWMADLYAQGAGGSFDKVGYHAYPKTIPARPTAFAFQELARVEGVVAQDDPADPKIWVTETGYSTTGPCRPDNVYENPCTPEHQAQGIPATVDALSQDPDVEVVLVFTLFDLSADEGTPEEIGFGLIDRNSKPKPAYCAVALDWTGIDPCSTDADHDSLPDVLETEAGTDPNNPDTDGDGTLDGFDTSPLDPTRAGPQGVAPALDSGPPDFTPDRTATFAFSDQLQGATFQCQFDGSAWGPCSSPTSYLKLTQKLHTFSVRAVDADGRSGLVATKKFTVDWTPPDTKIKSGPLGATADTSATFKFTSTEPGTFLCSLDGGAYTPCSSPAVYAGLTPGSHTFAAKAADRAGNVDPTAATRSWTVVG